MLQCYVITRCLNAAGSEGDRYDLLFHYWCTGFSELIPVVPDITFGFYNWQDFMTAVKVAVTCTNKSLTCCIWLLSYKNMEVIMQNFKYIQT
jgi:hypothetical protein